MKQYETEQPADDPIVKLLKERIYSDPELRQIIKEVFKEEFLAVTAKTKSRQTLTCKQLASLWQKCTKTIYDMSDEELKDLGYIRKRIGVNVRFEKID